MKKEHEVIALIAGGLLGHPDLVLDENWHDPEYWERRLDEAVHVAGHIVRMSDPDVERDCETRMSSADYDRWLARLKSKQSNGLDRYFD